MKLKPPAELLPWDTAFFGIRIARARTRRLDSASLRRLAAWCADERIGCVYALVPASDAASIRRATAAGFRDVGERVTLRASAGRRRAAAVHVTRPHSAEDVAALRRIARRAFPGARFFQDGRFPRRDCERLYETWIRKACDGAADAVLLAGPPGRPDGFVTCEVTGNGDGRIGLIAVRARKRGEGIGTALVRAALAWFAGHGVGKVSVVTQGANVAAARTYERCGFRVASREVWLHGWTDEVRAIRRRG